VRNSAEIKKQFLDMEQTRPDALILQGPDRRQAAETGTDGPPQHGKSKAVNDFVAWCAGVNPDIKVIFTSYSDELGNSANVELQRAIRSPLYKGIFGRTVIGLDNWVCNHSLIE
jgi:hypothetical protein